MSVLIRTPFMHPSHRMSPSYNGELLDYINQLEQMAEFILNGNFCIEYDDIN